MRLPSPGVALALLAALSGCGSCGSDEVETVPYETEPVDPSVFDLEDDPNQLYDREGNLLPSETVVAGLALPRGVEERPSRGERRHTYSTEVEMGKVQRYFGPRLMTGEVDRVGSAAVFRAAVPRDVQGGVVRLDVGLYPTPRGGTRIEIHELPPPPQTPISPEELIRRFDEDQRRLD